MSTWLKESARNPIVILLPFVAAMTIGWVIYIHVLNAPSRAEHNLLTTNSQGNLPTGWKIRSTSQFSQIQSKGYKGGKAFGVRMGQSKESLTIQTSVATVRQDKVYIYKSYHKSQVPFALLIKYFYEDGTSRLELLKQYGSSNQWTTDSLAFRADDQTTHVQIQYSLARTGTFLLDRPYLDQRSADVFVPKDPGAKKKNLLKNYNVDSSHNGLPDAWSRHSAGINTPKFAYVKKDGTAYIRTEVTGFKSGEASWQSGALGSESGQYIELSVDYRSNTSVHLMANYKLSGGEVVAIPVAELPPATQWTTAHASSEAPVGAAKLSVSAALWSNGRVETSNYQVKDITKEGDRHFRRPLVSIIFGDGWASTYATASRIMSFLGYKGTFYISPSSIGQPGFLSDVQVGQLLRSNNQLGSSSYEQIDLTTLNTVQLNRQLKLASGYTKNNLKQSDIDFLPPYGRSDPEVEASTRKYFHSSLSGGEGLNTKQTFDSYNLKAVHIDKSTSKQRIVSALDEAKAKNGWLILAYDRVEDNAPVASAVTSRAFTDQMEQVYKSKIPVVTISQGLEEEWGE